MLKGKIDIHADFGSAKKKTSKERGIMNRTVKESITPDVPTLGSSIPTRIPSSPLQSKDEIEWQLLIDRITQMKANYGFRKALNEWLDEGDL